MALQFNSTTFRQLKAFIILACFLILCISVAMMVYLLLMTLNAKNLMESESNQNRFSPLMEIQRTAELLNRINSTASNLAKALSSYTNGTILSFYELRTKVAPALFIALSINSDVSHVSYIGLDGLLYSYYTNNNQLFALYSNISHSSIWYTNPVNRDTGELYGDAVEFNPMLMKNESWFEKSMNSSSTYTAITHGWHKEEWYSLLLVTAPMDERGVISVGYPLELVVSHFEALDFRGGYLFLATSDGHVIIPTKAEDTGISIEDGLVKVKVGSMRDHVDLTCHPFGNSSNGVRGTEIGRYKFYCSTIDIAGVQTVPVLQYPTNGFAKLVERTKKAIFVLVLVLVMTVFSNCVFFVLTLKAVRREMFLCDALIKQLEATQQAERKSVNKTKAYAGISHDLHGSLAAVKGFIDICQENIKECKLSDLATNLSQMKTCTEDLLNLLRSSLDLSRLESGKASLEFKDFNLAQLLEEVVDMYYPLAMKKEVDIILDMCDGSILKLPLVKADRLKLKQILCNLIGNATKFTSQGHISVRAMVNRNNDKNSIMASNRTPTPKLFSWFYHRRKTQNDDTNSFENPNEVEIQFEVDDTGKGIPKDKQSSIFEDYVQVKETAGGQEGSGLGLGIVRSLVRIMKGELTIVEKEHGEKGICFRFNIFASTCENEENRFSPASPRQHYFQFMSPKPEPSSHIIMCIQGEERRRVLKKFIENLSIKVTIIDPVRDIRPQLERIKRRLDMSSFSPVKAAIYLSPSYSSNSDLESNIVLFVIDSNVAATYEFDRAVSIFRKEIPNCKIILLEDQISKKNRHVLGSDYVIPKPFHGSRLIRVLSLLKGNLPYNMSEKEKSRKMIGPPSTSKAQMSSFQFRQEGIEEEQVETNTSMPLKGKTILLVEDSKMLQHVTSVSLRKLGADVEICSNGKEAVHQVVNTMQDEKKEASCSKFVPYDYIFMDCEMPVMDGYKAVKLIREEERRHGVHIPIIALSGHATAEEARKSIDAGMDFHLIKPLQVDKLLEAIRSIDEELDRF